MPQLQLGVPLPLPDEPTTEDSIAARGWHADLLRIIRWLLPSVGDLQKEDRQVTSSPPPPLPGPTALPLSLPLRCRDAGCLGSLCIVVIALVAHKGKAILV